VNSAAHDQSALFVQVEAVAANRLRVKGDSNFYSAKPNHLIDAYISS
jgi:hypothetical protein